MLTKLTVRNFKRFDEAEIELGEAVVLIGPNNSGKTTALQTLALWEVGLRKWNERRAGRAAPGERPGVTINRRDLLSNPVPDAKLLWKDLHVRNVERLNGKTQRTENIRIEVVVDGVTEDRAWRCGLEFDYANEESLYCRPVRLADGDGSVRMPIPEAASKIRIAFLPPMSGLAASETRLDRGAINVRVGEGRTAEVLRNLCHSILSGEGGGASWASLVSRIEALFGVTIQEPRYVEERGEITMAYKEAGSTALDISCAGRGLHQTLLLVAYLLANPAAVLLLDEPDAHLEILRQRQIYQLLTDVCRKQGNQVIIATHSEILLNEAAGRDLLIAFVGKPHRIDDRGHQVLKSLREIGFEDYYQAERKGWVLYLEGATDLAVLRAFAETLRHEARGCLERPFVHYVGNDPLRARRHFHGLREAMPGLIGLALFDQVERSLQTESGLQELMWTRREIENYLFLPEVLEAYAASAEPVEGAGPLFAKSETERRRGVMEECIRSRIPPAALRDRNDRWWMKTKATDDVLDLLFEGYFRELGLPNLLRKSSYHILARLAPAELIDPEVVQKLDAIASVARQAERRTE